MRRTQETVLLGVFEDDGITIIDTMQPARDLRIAAAPGQRLPYSAGSFGRAFLAWMREQDIDRLIAAYGLRRFTETTITDPARYKTSLEQVRQQGFAIDDSEEYLEGVWAVSAPINDADAMLAVLTVVGFTSRMQDDSKRIASEATTQTAQQISLAMGAPSEGPNRD